MSGYLARRFDEERRLKFTRFQTHKFLSILKKDTYAKVCDVGCGKGYWEYVLLKNNLVRNEVWGCDVYNDYETDEIKSLNSKINAGYAYIENSRFPFSDKSFDLVFSIDVIEHVIDDRLFLSEHIRIAKPGATILIGTPNYWRICNIILKTLGMLRFPRVLGKDNYGPAIHLREYTSGKLLDLANLFHDKIETGTLQLVPCFFGLPIINFGFDSFPKALNEFCHFWFMTFVKKKM